MSTKINLRQVVFSLSRALDLVGVDDMHHGKRVAFMAYACSQHLPMDNHERDTLIQAAMLHDCGVSNTNTHSKLVKEFDWNCSQIHCKVGEQLLSSCPVFSHLAPVIAYHHTHWKRLQDLDIPNVIERDSNLIFLVDRVDALIAQQNMPEPIMAKKIVREKIKSYRGTLFSPELVESFLKASNLSAFWLTLESEPLYDMLRGWVAGGQDQMIDFDSLRSIAQIFAKIVDAKSPFTVEHSQGVARLAKQLAHWDGQSAEVADKLELAGLLHDLGKLRIPDEILDKPDKLNEMEFSVMQGHSFESHYILKDIAGLEEVALWCSQHHEKINGSGYPFKSEGDEISRPSRILAVADVFQALAQKRPYRGSLQLEDIFTIMDNMVQSGNIDASLVNLIREHEKECYQIALFESD
ncbi:MAG: HD domain-containing protein [Gammaproteobacteria bacterium]|nr:HD domain-containing protein [Gammaproteobacteria bacterium]